MKKNFFFLVLLAILFSFSACSDDDDDDIITCPVYSYTEGFFILNEDWFGHDNGTVNFFYNNDSIAYRVYRAANTNETLGKTSQFATIYKGNAYMTSKQGNRLVVADAKMMRKIASVENIGGGDGRAFVGISDKLGYISTSTGIVTFNIANNTVGEAITGIDEEIGDMCFAGKYVFAVGASEKIYIIDVTTNTLNSTLEDNVYYAATKSKDGNIWLGASGKLIKVDPQALKKTEFADPNIVLTTSWPWGVWSSHSLSASAKTNTLYWKSEKSVYKYDIDENKVTPNIYTLTKDSEGNDIEFYGAGLKLNPANDQLVLTVIRSGFGVNYSYNWVYILNNNGTLNKIITVKSPSKDASGTYENYYWCPAMPFFYSE